MHPEFPLSLPQVTPSVARRLPPPSVAPTAFSETLERIGAEVDRGERLVRGALGAGRGLDAGQLIALQAGIYRYTEVVDLSSKLVDKATAAVRTTLQSSG